MVVVVARFLGAIGFGQLSYALSFIWIFWIIVDLGLNDLFIRDVAAKRELLEQYVSNILSIKIILGGLAYFFIVVFSYFTVANGIIFYAICLVGLTIIFDSYAYIFRSLFRIKEIMHYEAVLLILEGIIKLGIIIYVMKLPSMSNRVILVSGCLLLTSVINFLLALFCFQFNLKKKISLSLDWRFCKNLLKRSFPFIVIYIFGLLNFKIAILMLSKMKGSLVAGLFSADVKLLEAILIVPLTLSFVIFPVFSRLSDYVKNNLFKIFRVILPLLLVVGCFFSLILYFFGKGIIAILYGKEFSDAYVVLQVLCWVLVPFFLKPVLEKLLCSIKAQNMVVYGYIAVSIFCIFLNLFLIPSFAMIGASVSIIISEVLAVIVLLICLKRINREIKCSLVV